MEYEGLRTAESTCNALDLRSQVNRKRISRPIRFLPVDTIIPDITDLNIVPTARIPHRHRKMKLIKRIHGNPSRSNLIARRTALRHLSRGSPCRDASGDIAIGVIKLVIALPVKSNVNIVV